MAAGYVVTAPLVITKKEDGSDLYLYENAEVPDFVTTDEIKRLVDVGLVSEVTAAGKRKQPAAESN